MILVKFKSDDIMYMTLEGVTQDNFEMDKAQRLGKRASGVKSDLQVGFNFNLSSE